MYQVRAIKILDVTVTEDGSVAMYIRNSIDYKLRGDLSVKDLEFLCIERRKTGAKAFLISNWYSPSNSPIELFEKFEILLD